MRRRWSALWRENVEAWELYRRLTMRSVRDLELAGPLILRELAGRSTSDVWDVMARVSIILDVMFPEQGRENTPTPNNS